MSTLDQIFSKAQPIKASANQWMIPKEEEQQKGGWTQPAPPPPADPFQPPPPWTGATAPPPVATPPSRWMEQLYADLKARINNGLDMLDQQPDLPAELQQKYVNRIQQLAWQMHLMELVVRELAPCPPTLCPNRVGSGPGLHLDASIRERYVWDLRQAHEAGLVAITLTTPNGRNYILVPWKSSTPPAATELDPLDVAALVRVAALAGTDELTLLDLLPVKEVNQTT